MALIAQRIAQGGPIRPTILWVSQNWISFAVRSDSLQGVYYDVGICRSGEVTCDCQGCELGGHICKHIRRCIETMSAIVSADSRTQAIAEFREKRGLIKSQIMPEGASDAEFELFIEVSAQYGLNPLNGEIWAIRGKGSKTGPGPIKPRVGYEGYYRKAQEHPDFEWMAVEAFYANDDIKINLGTGEISHIPAMGDQGKLIGCWVQVKKKSRPQPFVRRYFLETLRPPERKSKDGYVLTTPWDSNPLQMLIGAATRLTLKGLFSLYLPPETDIEAEFAEPEPALPASKAKALKAPVQESPAESPAEAAVQALEAAVAEEKADNAADEKAAAKAQAIQEISEIATPEPLETSITETVVATAPAPTREATSDLAEGSQGEDASSIPDVSSTSAAPEHLADSEPADKPSPEPEKGDLVTVTPHAPAIGLGFGPDDVMINREKAEIDTDAALAVLGFPGIDHPSAYSTIVPKVSRVEGVPRPIDLEDAAFALFGKWVRKVARREWTVPDALKEFILEAAKAPVDPAVAAAESMESAGDFDPLADDAPTKPEPAEPKRAKAKAKEDGQGEGKPGSSSPAVESTSRPLESGEGAALSTAPSTALGDGAILPAVRPITPGAALTPADDEYDPFTDPEMADLVAEYKEANARELEAIKYLQDRGVVSTNMTAVRKGRHWIDMTLRHKAEGLPEMNNALVAWIIVEGMAVAKAEVKG